MNTTNSLCTRSKRRPARGRTAGFTLVELMVVIAIIATLATIVGVNVLGALDDNDVAAAQSQISNLKTAVVMFRTRFNRLPDSLDELVNNPKGNLLDSEQVPKDPWGNDFIYRKEGSRDFEIISYGADGSQGGSGYEADISSKDLSGDS